MTAPSSNIRIRSVQGPSRYANIDGLRAVAALCVMTEHMFGDILRQTSPGSGIFRTGLVTITETVSLGRFGVALFFLISGFVVPFSLRGQRPVTHFAISRLCRLYPAMWLAIALLTTLDWIGGELPRPTVVLANMSMFPTLFGQSWLSPIYWTLSIEFIFYVGTALLFLAGRQRSAGVVSAVAMGLVAATLVPVLMRTHDVMDLPVQYVGFHLSFPFLGLLLRLAMVERVRGAWPAVASVLIAQVTTVVAAADFSLARGDEFVLDGLVPVLAAYVLAVAVFCVAVALDRPRSVLLGQIGMTSYSMYLLHWIINVNVYRVLPLTGRVGDIATMLVCVASTVAVSAAVYRLIERPMIRLGRTLGARGPRPADASERTRSTDVRRRLAEAEPSPGAKDAPSLEVYAMTVSVILKTLNEEARIAAAVESVMASLEGIGGEIIVADSGSSDRTVALAAGYPVRVVQIAAGVKPSCGIGPQLGFQYSREPFICLMDGDMLLDRGFLREALAYLAAHPATAGVTGHVEEMNVSNLEFVRRVRRTSPENRTGSIDRMNGGGLYRREAVAQVGYFSDRNLHGYEEFDLGLRLRSQGWSLHRLDRRFVCHFGHVINAYALLVRRWKSGYLRGIGEVMRASIGKPQWRHLMRDLPELKLWAAVYAWWAAMVTVPLVAPTLWLGLGLDLCLTLGVLALMALRQRSLTLGLYAIVAWVFHAAALPLGFFNPRRAPEAWIESRVLGEVQHGSRS